MFPFELNDRIEDTGKNDHVAVRQVDQALHEIDDRPLPVKHRPEPMVRQDLTAYQRRRGLKADGQAGMGLEAEDGERKEGPTALAINADLHERKRRATGKPAPRPERTLPIRGSVGIGQPNAREDMRTARRAMSLLGHYPRVQALARDQADNPVNPEDDPDVIPALKSFQAAHGVRIDGVMKPGGETQATATPLLAAKLAKEIGEDLDNPRPFTPKPNPIVARIHPLTPTRVSVPWGAGMGFDDDDTTHRLALDHALVMRNTDATVSASTLLGGASDDFLDEGTGMTLLNASQSSTGRSNTRQNKQKPRSGVPPQLRDIDVNVIHELEGYKAKMYTLKDPDDDTKPHPKSGPTIGNGVDLGQMKNADLDRLVADYGLDPGLANRLRPYLGRKGADAKTFVTANPLTINRDEAQALSRAKYVQIREDLEAAYDKAQQARGSTLRFEDLPYRMRTVIMSVGIQYGAGLSKRTPTFWGHALNEDQVAMLRELRNFNDKYETRRLREANYLQFGIVEKSVDEDDIWNFRDVPAGF